MATENLHNHVIFEFWISYFGEILAIKKTAASRVPRPFRLNSLFWIRLLPSHLPLCCLHSLCALLLLFLLLPLLGGFAHRSSYFVFFCAPPIPPPPPPLLLRNELSRICFCTYIFLIFFLVFCVVCSRPCCKLCIVFCLFSYFVFL